MKVTELWTDGGVLQTHNTPSRSSGYDPFFHSQWGQRTYVQRERERSEIHYNASRWIFSCFIIQYLDISSRSLVSVEVEEDRDVFELSLPSLTRSSCIRERQFHSNAEYDHSITIGLSWGDRRLQQRCTIVHSMWVNEWIGIIWRLKREKIYRNEEHTVYNHTQVTEPFKPLINRRYITRYYCLIALGHLLYIFIKRDSTTRRFYPAMILDR